jgi:hypothetical protein
MKSVRIIAMSLFLLGAVACEGDGGGGGADCPAQCERLVPLCRYDQAFDHEECQTSCETGTAGKTAASIAAAAACIDQATSCAVALACEDLLAAPAASGSPRERAEASARGLCGKLESCGMPADQRGECVAQGEVMLPYVTDVAKFVGCVDAQSCTDLFTDESVLVDCLALVWASFRCEGDTTLHYCDLDGVCVAADCAEVCDELADGVTVDTGCGGSGTTAEEHPKCRCYQR